MESSSNTRLKNNWLTDPRAQIHYVVWQIHHEALAQNLSNTRGNSWTPKWGIQCWFHKWEMDLRSTSSAIYLWDTQRLVLPRRNGQHLPWDYLSDFVFLAKISRKRKKNKLLFILFSHFRKAFYTGLDLGNNLESVEKTNSTVFVFTIETFQESKWRLKKYMQNILLSKHNWKQSTKLHKYAEWNSIEHHRSCLHKRCKSHLIH